MCRQSPLLQMFFFTKVSELCFWLHKEISVTEDIAEKIKFLFHGVTCGNAVFAHSKTNLLILILAFYMTKCFHMVNTFVTL